MLDFTAQLDALIPTALTGTVAQTVGMTVAAAGFPAPVGAVAEIQREAGAALLAEVIGFRDESDAVVSLQRPGRHPPRQPRAAGADQPLAADRRGVVGTGDRRRRQHGGRPAQAGAGRADRLHPPAAASLHPPAHLPAAGHRHPRHRRPALPAARGSGWGFSPARGWARACCWA